MAPLALGGEAPRLRVPEQDAQEGAGPGSALSSSETNNSSRRERSPSKSPAPRALLAPAPGRSRPASLPALLPHMKQLQSRGFWGVGAGVCARAGVSVCVFNSFPPLLPLPACSPACLRPQPSLSTHRRRGRARHTPHTLTHTRTRTRRLHEWEAGANPRRLGEPRLTDEGSRTAPLHRGAPRR